MPLLICPNDESAMQTATRSGIEFDFCPACRGIWLDRGELEKLMGAARQALSPSESPAPFAPPALTVEDQRGFSRAYGDSYRDRRRGDDDGNDHRRKKRRGFDIFDIFD